MFCHGKSAGPTLNSIAIPDLLFQNSIQSYEICIISMNEIPRFQTHLFHSGSDTSVCFRVCTAPCKTTVCCFWPWVGSPVGAPAKRRRLRQLSPPQRYSCRFCSSTCFGSFGRYCSHLFGAAGWFVSIQNSSSNLLPVWVCQKLGYEYPKFYSNGHFYWVTAHPQTHQYDVVRARMRKLHLDTLGPMFHCRLLSNKKWSQAFISWILIQRCSEQWY